MTFWLLEFLHVIYEYLTATLTSGHIYIWDRQFSYGFRTLHIGRGTQFSFGLRPTDVQMNVFLLKY